MLRTTATIEECYRRYDGQNKGYLTKSELKWAVTALLGSAPTRLVLLSLFEISSESYDSVQVDKDTFVRVMGRRLANVDVAEAIRRWFKAFDLDSSGFISFSNFTQVTPWLHPSGMHSRAWLHATGVPRNSAAHTTYRGRHSLSGSRHEPRQQSTCPCA
ncbi:hypothetical protein, variant 2 [Aphanomyces invadans]|uniref:EF-hand domain-containing protein n=1 Tax=Aphanomyces invadans TaxID=157072 RepID=A0A024TTI0_9STRA|nr:hypothetical protein, variant 2 [Aphanomyces invadans]ETV96637.1 hypothetical protein, variant 2 [Aphanomyces invadans]|eukprot:XP_008874900.1 hypothetical protein, variant 2 [Aphanomyces invadans]